MSGWPCDAKIKFKKYRNCHCKAEHIDGISINALCPIEKFTEYIFNEFNNKGKKYLFVEWGFTIADSIRIKADLEKQAYRAYLSGEYKLGKLDKYGQRISIAVKLTRKNGEQVSFITGWMDPDGKIILTTPYGDKIK